MRYQYRREYLKDRKWHKFVIYSCCKMELVRILDRMQGPVMLSTNGYLIVMLEEENDRMLFKLLITLQNDEDRGYGDWYDKKYHSRNGNRITK